MLNFRILSENLLRLFTFFQCQLFDIEYFRCSATMLWAVLLSLITIHTPLLTEAANSNIHTKNRRLPPNALKNDSSSPCPSTTLTSKTPRTYRPPSTAAHWDRTSCHSNVSNTSSVSSAFTESRTGGGKGFKDFSNYSQAWSTGSGSSRATVIVSNCSQSLLQSTPEPKCNCLHLQTTTVVVTVTTTIHPDHTCSSGVGSQTLPSVPSSSYNATLEPSLGVPPNPEMSSHTLDILNATATALYHHSVGQAPSSQNISRQSASVSSPLPGPKPLTVSEILSMSTMSVLILTTNDQSSSTIIPEPTGTVPINTAKISSTSFPSDFPTANVQVPPAQSSKSSTSSTRFPEITGVSTLSNFHSLLPSTPVYSISNFRPGGNILGPPFPSGGVARLSAYSNLSEGATRPTRNGSSGGPPLRYSVSDVSCGSSLVRTYSDQIPSPQGSPYDAPASPATATASVPSSTSPTPAASPVPSIMLPSIIYSPPITSQTIVLPSSSIPPSSPIVPWYPAVPRPLATAPNIASPPYANISQATNQSTSSSSTGPPYPTYHTVLPSQGLNSSSRLHNGSLHSVICFPNTTSITRILANVRLAALSIFFRDTLPLIGSSTAQYDSPRLGHHLPKFYRGLNYTSFALTNESASVSPPNYLMSPANAPLKSIAITSAPFISFSLRSVALSCFQAGALPQSACTILVIGTKVAGVQPNGTSASNQVKKRITIAGADSGIAPGMMKVDLDGGGVRDWTGLESVAFDAEIDGKPAGVGIDDLEYDLMTKGCFFDAE